VPPMRSIAGRTAYPSVGWRFPLDGFARKDHVVAWKRFHAVKDRAYRKKRETDSSDSAAGGTVPIAYISQ